MHFHGPTTYDPHACCASTTTAGPPATLCTPPPAWWSSSCSGSWRRQTCAACLTLHAGCKWVPGLGVVMAWHGDVMSDRAASHSPHALSRQCPPPANPAHRTSQAAVGEAPEGGALKEALLGGDPRAPLDAAEGAVHAEEAAAQAGGAAHAKQAAQAEQAAQAAQAAQAGEAADWDAQLDYNGAVVLAASCALAADSCGVRASAPQVRGCAGRLREFWWAGGHHSGGCRQAPLPAARSAGVGAHHRALCAASDRCCAPAPPSPRRCPGPFTSSAPETASPTAWCPSRESRSSVLCASGSQLVPGWGRNACLTASPPPPRDRGSERVQPVLLACRRAPLTAAFSHKPA